MSVDHPAWDESQEAESDFPAAEDDDGTIFLTEERDEAEEAELLADGTLDLDEVDPLLDPYDEGADDELQVVDVCVTGRC